MSALLTIAIPTYKRAPKLDSQLAWLDRAICGYEPCCRLIVSDNASPDDTPVVCSKWQQSFGIRGVEMRIVRNPNNIGPLANIAGCINRSTTPFTWVIGDDDQIPVETLGFVVRALRENPTLASILLNFSGVGKTEYERCYEFASDTLAPGREIVAECLRRNYFGLAFMTAHVYRTQFAQAAIRAWPEGTRNYDFQVFVTAAAAMNGEMLATREARVAYVTGENIYETDKRVALRLYADSLEVFARLTRIGYDPALCRRIAREHLWKLKKRFVKRALTNNPLLTAATVARSARYLAQLSAAGSGSGQI